MRNLLPDQALYIACIIPCGNRRILKRKIEPYLGPQGIGSCLLDLFNGLSIRRQVAQYLVPDLGTVAHICVLWAVMIRSRTATVENRGQEQVKLWRFKLTLYWYLGALSVRKMKAQLLQRSNVVAILALFCKCFLEVRYICSHPSLPRTPVGRLLAKALLPVFRIAIHFRARSSKRFRLACPMPQIIDVLDI